MITSLYDEKGNRIIYCAIEGCKQFATGWRNSTINCASSVPSHFIPVCSNHNYILFGASK